MGYIKIAHRKILNHLDSNPTPPNNWKKFIQKQSILHNLIIKSNKNKCFCTYCKHEFISNKEINRTTKCPNCNNKYLIKRSNLRHYEFKDYLSILDFIDNTFIIRYFELKTIIDATHNHNSSVVEFGREIINNNYSRNVFVNERVSKCQCNIHINHSNYFNEMKWRKYTRYYSLIDYSIVFPDNIKEILKDTEYKYSYIWELAKHSTYIDLLNLIRKTEDITKVELLTKMKLYNLALSASDFKNNGSFQKIFGIPKDYYTFMKRNNIT